MYKNFKRLFTKSVTKSYHKTKKTPYLPYDIILP